MACSTASNSDVGSVSGYRKHKYGDCRTASNFASGSDTARLWVIKVRSHHAAPTPITLAESCTADGFQAGRSGLQMSLWPGIVIHCTSYRVGVSKASAFRFVSRTVCSPYPTLNIRRPSFSSRRCTDLEQSSAAYHICSVTSRLLYSLEDILLGTLLPVITVVVPAK